MAAKQSPETIKKQRANMQPCHEYDLKKKRQYLHYGDGRRMWIKVGDPRFREWPLHNPAPERESAGYGSGAAGEYG